MKWLKIRCGCGHLTLIPTYGRLIVAETINCEECNAEILEVNVGMKKAEPKQAVKSWSNLFTQNHILDARAG